MSSTQLYNESDMESYFLRSVNWLIPTLHGVYPAGRNTLSAHKRECFPPISDSSARKCKRVLLHFARPTSPVNQCIPTLQSVCLCVAACLRAERRQAQGVIGFEHLAPNTKASFRDSRSTSLVRVNGILSLDFLSPRPKHLFN